MVLSRHVNGVVGCKDPGSYYPKVMVPAETPYLWLAGNGGMGYNYNYYYYYHSSIPY